MGPWGATKKRPGVEFEAVEKIEAADLFQLCWSRNARVSTEVETEWRAALALHRKDFIRPCYWQRPMPDRPPELEKIHFAHLRVGWHRRMWSRLRGDVPVAVKMGTAFLPLCPCQRR
jgi:hypothetical protein